jgi:hypothetical protein
MKKVGFFSAGLILAFIASIIGRTGSYEYYRFKIGNFPKEPEAAEVTRTIRFFSSTLAGFYTTGGLAAGLNTFPAEKLVKRRIFQDTRNWQEQGKVLAMDRDTSSLKQLIFVGPNRAVVVMDEAWYSVFQDAETRRPISLKRANLITVRYYLKKMQGLWLVVEYEVYPQSSPLPPMALESFLKW